MEQMTVRKAFTYKLMPTPEQEQALPATARSSASPGLAAFTSGGTVPCWASPRRSLSFEKPTAGMRPSPARRCLYSLCHSPIGRQALMWDSRCFSSRLKVKPSRIPDTIAKLSGSSRRLTAIDELEEVQLARCAQVAAATSTDSLDRPLPLVAAADLETLRTPVEIGSCVVPQ